MAWSKAFSEIVNELQAEPNTENWLRFEEFLKKSSMKYYKIFFREGDISSEQDLTASYAALYDHKKKESARIPLVVRKSDGGIEGSLFFLRTLRRLG